MTVEDSAYHYSTWQPTHETFVNTHIKTEKRIKVGEMKGLLNPLSKHPTQKGHVMIADILDEFIR